MTGKRDGEWSVLYQARDRVFSGMEYEIGWLD